MAAGDRRVPWWGWVLVAVLLGAGGLLGLAVVLLGLITASAPDCNAVTASGKWAMRIGGVGLIFGVLAAWSGAAVAAIRSRVALLARVAIAALPLVLVPLLATSVEAGLDRRLDAIGDDGNGSSCY